MGTRKIKRQFGLWDSPITPASLARGISFSNVECDQDGTLVWLEGRSDRGVLVVQPPDGQAPRDLNSDFSIRAKVGYGGGDFSVSQGYVYFVDSESGRIYRQPHTWGAASPVTPALGKAASPVASPDGRWLVFVHTYEDQDALGVVDCNGNFWPQKLVFGEDFYMQPTWHPDSRRIAWVAWNHPNMPWDGTKLKMATLIIPENGLPFVEDTMTLAGDENTSIFQPQFSPDGRWLAYSSDASGWWQLYIYDLERHGHRQLTSAQAEHGAPAWIQGLRTYIFSRDGKSLFFLRNQDGSVSLWQLDIDTGVEIQVPLGDTYTALNQVCTTPDGLAMIASGPAAPTRIISIRPSSRIAQPKLHIWRRSLAEELPVRTYAEPQAITYPGMDGGRVHGLYYPPKSEKYEGVGKPPLLINIHGGPTGQVFNSFNLQAQYFTSRGFAVLYVNYRGSTGYGREYRNMLRGSWGIYDVQDAVSGARYLAEQGLVDGERMVIQGGSAGGFTVLMALEDYPGFFKAGICLFGVSNQFTLTAETHKFEAFYNDTLIGPLPEASQVYRERSPIFFMDKIQDPIAIFQGEIDVVVPRKQSDEVAASLERRGVPHVYHVYPGEGHGFRKVETIEHFYKAVEQFLRQYVIYA